MILVLEFLYAAPSVSSIYVDSYPFATLSKTSIENVSSMTGISAAEDMDLVSRWQAGDMRAFEELFQRYHSDAYNIAYSMMSNPDDAQDLAQEAFVRAYQSIRKFKKQASFRTWISRITTNLCLDELRKRKRRRTDTIGDQPILETQADDNPSPLENLLEEERAQLLQQMLDALPEKYRALIVLRDIQGHPYQEIADILDLSLGRVKSRLHEARQELKNVAARQGWLK